MFKPPQRTDTPKHAPLNVKWEIKEKEELADYYWYMAERAKTTNERAFYLKGYIDIKDINLPEVYLRSVVKGKIDFFMSRGYNLSDLACHCRMDRQTMKRLKDPPDTHTSGNKVLNDSYLCALFYFEPEIIKGDPDG